jgi:hypothetical protein
MREGELLDGGVVAGGIQLGRLVPATHGPIASFQMSEPLQRVGVLVNGSRRLRVRGPCN